MPIPTPRAYAVRRGRVAGVGVAVVALTAVALGLTACGTARAPDPGGSSRSTPSAPVRVLTGQALDPEGGLSCPASLASAEGMAVPRPPEGVQGSARLLPDREPRSLVVCGYPVLDIMATTPIAPPFPRSTRSLLTGPKRAEVVDLLTWAPRSTGQPRACTMMAGNETAYLIGATYDDAAVWVAAKDDANSCSQATNGDFVAGAAVGVDVAAVVGARTPPPGSGGTCASTTRGRLGDDVSLVPPGSPTVTVCRDAADASSHATSLSRATGDEAVAALRALPARATDLSCIGSEKPSDSRFRLVLSYPEGPPVRIQVDPSCDPQVVGSNLTAPDAGALVALVERWSPPIPGPDPDGSVSSPSAATPGPG